MPIPLNRRNTDCRPEDILPEVCYRKNRRRWEREIACKDPVDPCAIDISGTLPPPGGRPPRPPRPVGRTVSNQEVLLGCPAPYTGDSERGDDPTPYQVRIPPATFNRFVTDNTDEAAILATQTLVDRLALGYAYSQIRCFAPNDPVHESCPEGSYSDEYPDEYLYDASDEYGPSGAILNPAHTTQAVLESGAVWERLSGFLSLTDEAARFELTEEEVEEGFIIYEALSRNFYEVVDVSQLDAPGGYLLRDDYSLEDIFGDLHEVDSAEATAAARLTALSLLTCEYLSPGVELSCPTDPNGREPSVALGRPDALVEEGRFRFLLDVLAGDTEIPDLHSQAVAEALSLLNCVYSNDEQTATCPPAINPEDEAEIAAFGRSSSTVPVDTVRSEFIPEPGVLPIPFPPDLDSVDDLNQQALLLAWSSLQCLYPNLPRSASCAPDTASVICKQRSTVITGLKLLSLDLPPSEGTSNARRVFDACKETPENKSTDVDPVTVRDLGIANDNISAILNECNPITFQNTLQCYGTPQAMPSGGWTADPGVSLEGSVEAGLFLRAAQKEEGLVDTEAATAAFLLAEADAQTYIEGITICLFCNEPVEPMACDPALQIDSDTVRRKYDVETPSRKICKCEFTSPLSKADAQRAAWAAALASRECIPGQYGNREISLICGESSDGRANFTYISDFFGGEAGRPSAWGTSRTVFKYLGSLSVPGVCLGEPCILPSISEPGSVEPNTFFGETQRAADLAALAYACGISRCGWGNQLMRVSAADCQIDQDVSRAAAAGGGDVEDYTNTVPPSIGIKHGDVEADVFIEYGDPAEAKMRANDAAEALAVASRICVADNEWYTQTNTVRLMQYCMNGTIVSDYFVVATPPEDD